MSAIKVSVQTFMQVLLRVGISPRSPAPILGTFVVFWTTFHTILSSASDLHVDMMEAFAWGQELQWGYYKHPPFWSWVTYTWFSLFPIRDWAAYLLCAVNVAAGVFFVARCSQFFLESKRLAWTAALLLLFTPTNIFLSAKINANTIQLSVWPAAMWAFLSLLDRPRRIKALVLGLLLSCTLLSKYNGLLLVGCLLISAAVHPAGRTFGRSTMPLFVAAGSLPLCGIHAAWLWQSDFLPFSYFDSLRGATHGAAMAVFVGFRFLAAMALYASPAVIVLAVFNKSRHWSWDRACRHSLSPVLFVLALGPPLATAIAGSVLGTKCPPLWGTAALQLAPVLAVRGLTIVSPTGLYLRVATSIVVLLGLSVMASPVIAWSLFQAPERWRMEPRFEVARALTRWWRQTYHLPLRIVGGNFDLATATTWYSADHPSYFASSNRRLTPWITEQMLERDGALLICNDHDEGCEIEALKLNADGGGERHIVVSRRSFGLLGMPSHFSFFVVPPSGSTAGQNRR